MTPRTARCRALPEAAVSEGNQGLQGEGVVADAPIEGRCGVISSFDGLHGHVYPQEEVWVSTCSGSN